MLLSGRLYHLDSLFTFSSIYHNLLENNGRIVWCESKGMDAIACNGQFYFYHLVDDAGGYRRIVDVVDILRLLVQIILKSATYRV